MVWYAVVVLTALPDEIMSDPSLYWYHHIAALVRAPAVEMETLHREHTYNMYACIYHCSYQGEEKVLYHLAPTVLRIGTGYGTALDMATVWYHAYLRSDPLMNRCWFQQDYTLQQ